MSPALRRALREFRTDLLDRQTWETPDRLSDDEFRAEAGPDWRRIPTTLEDLEDER